MLRGCSGISVTRGSRHTREFEGLPLSICPNEQVRPVSEARVCGAMVVAAILGTTSYVILTTVADLQISQGTQVLRPAIVLIDWAVFRALIFLSYRLWDNCASAEHRLQWYVRACFLPTVDTLYLGWSAYEAIEPYMNLAYGRNEYADIALGYGFYSIVSFIPDHHEQLVYSAGNNVMLAILVVSSWRGTLEWPFAWGFANGTGMQVVLGTIIFVRTLVRRLKYENGRVSLTGRLAREAQYYWQYLVLFVSCLMGFGGRVRQVERSCGSVKLDLPDYVLHTRRGEDVEGEARARGGWLARFKDRVLARAKENFRSNVCHNYLRSRSYGGDVYVFSALPVAVVCWALFAGFYLAFGELARRPDNQPGTEEEVAWDAIKNVLDVIGLTLVVIFGVLCVATPKSAKAMLRGSVVMIDGDRTKLRWFNFKGELSRSISGALFFLQGRTADFSKDSGCYCPNLRMLGNDQKPRLVTDVRSLELLVSTAVLREMRGQYSVRPATGLQSEFHISGDGASVIGLPGTTRVAGGEVLSRVREATGRYLYRHRKR